MAGYVFGIGILAFSCARLYRDRSSDRRIDIVGTVTEELSRQSTQVGRRSLMYAPRATYQHPATGRVEVYEPERFTGDRFSPGEDVLLRYDPDRDRVFHPAPRPLRDTVILAAVGFGFIAAQFFDGR